METGSTSRKCFLATLSERISSRDAEQSQVAIYKVKWQYTKSNVKVGDLVLIAGENTPRGLWPLGLVVEVYEGDDGLVRSVKVKTKCTHLVRPITKIVMLEGSG